MKYYKKKQIDYRRVKKKWVDIRDKKFYAKSMQEYNFAYFLQQLKNAGKIKDWFYESDIFWFEDIKSGTMNYKPDFKVIGNDDLVLYHEIKGFVTPKFRTQIRRMKKYHPDVKIIIWAVNFSHVTKELSKVPDLDIRRYELCHKGQSTAGEHLKLDVFLPVAVVINILLIIIICVVLCTKNHEIKTITAHYESDKKIAESIRNSYKESIAELIRSGHKMKPDKKVIKNSFF